MTSGRHLFSKDGQIATPLPSAATAIDPQAVREQLQRILSDPLFHNSKRFSSLLKFIVGRTLDGQHRSLKERIIGIEVFERSPDYDPGIDAIVRVAATEVRKRLAAYYKEPAHCQEIRIELPLRSYAAEFRAPISEAAGFGEKESKEKQSAQQDERPSSRPRALGWLAAIAAVLVLCAAALSRLPVSPPAIDEFWAPLLTHSEPVALILNSQQESELQIEYRKRDLSAATALMSFIGMHRKGSVLRYLQNTELSDLRRQPSVVIGSIRNEWIVRLGSGLRYQTREAPDTSWIEDSTDPDTRNWHAELSTPDTERKEYALITRALNSSTGQWWLGISGLTDFGTQLAQELIVDSKAMAALSQQLPKDWPAKNLQIVLELDVVNKSPGAAHVVATHTW